MGRQWRGNWEGTPDCVLQGECTPPPGPRYRAEMGIWASPTAGAKAQRCDSHWDSMPGVKGGTLEPGFLRLSVLRHLPDRWPAQDEANRRWGDAGCQQIQLIPTSIE